MVTTPLASYLEFDPFTWQRDTIQGIQWAIDHPGEVVERVRQGQRYAIDNYSERCIAQRFVETINAIRNTSQK